MRKRLKIGLLAGAALLGAIFLGDDAKGSIMWQAEEASTTYTSAFGSSIDSVIDQSGLRTIPNNTPVTYQSGVTLADDFKALNPYHPAYTDSFWTTRRPDFGGVINFKISNTSKFVEEILLWNYASPGNDSHMIRGFELYASDNSDASGSLGTLIGTYETDNTWGMQAFEINSSVTDLKMRILSTHGRLDRMTLMEAAFVVADGGGSDDGGGGDMHPVAEPATMAMWSGLGMIGLAFGYRQRRKKQAPPNYDSTS